MDGQDSPMVVAQERLHPKNAQKLPDLRLPEDMVSVEVNKVPESDCATLDLCKGSFTTWRKKMRTLATVGKVNMF